MLKPFTQTPLIRKAGVPLPEAREIWRSIASKGDVGCRGESDVAWRQIRELRLQLNEGRRVGDSRRTEQGADLDWMFPLPLLQTWAECQTRIILNAWLGWATPLRATADGLFVDRVRD